MSIVILFLSASTTDIVTFIRLQGSGARHICAALNKTMTEANSRGYDQTVMNGIFLTQTNGERYHCHGRVWSHS
jgi:hypothetical protein